MDKQSKPKSRIMKFLPRAASAVSFYNPPFSPGRENLRPQAARGFSGPIKISIIPDEARTKPRNSGFEEQEPTSPKVSCIGQIKHNKKKIKELARRTSTSTTPAQPSEQKHPSVIKRMLTGAKVLGRAKSNVAAVPTGKHRRHEKPPLPDRTPGLSQMKRFSSGRGALASFDWTAQIAAADVRGPVYHSESEDGEEGGGRIPLSPGIWISEEVGPLQPRKEVNLWKRRTIVPPNPLQLTPKQ